MRVWLILWPNSWLANCFSVWREIGVRKLMIACRIIKIRSENLCPVRIEHPPHICLFASSYSMLFHFGFGRVETKQLTFLISFTATIEYKKLRLS